MEISPITLAIMLLRSFEIGAVSGIFYDIQRVIRAFFGIGAIEKHKSKTIARKERRKRWKNSAHKRCCSLAAPELKMDVARRIAENGTPLLL